jgi:hypothetical protein
MTVLGTSTLAPAGTLLSYYSDTDFVENVAGRMQVKQQRKGNFAQV